MIILAGTQLCLAMISVSRKGDGLPVTIGSRSTAAATQQQEECNTSAQWDHYQWHTDWPHAIMVHHSLWLADVILFLKP
jgi:hypothetical protein